MARIKLDLPASFTFTTNLPIRITDLNYSGHLGNDRVFSLVHEARVQYLQHFGYSEMNMGGVGLIMSDAAVEFKQEAFYGDVISVSVVASAISKIGFDLYYKLEKLQDGRTITVALVKTGMVCFDYTNKKVAYLPEAVKAKIGID